MSRFSKGQTVWMGRGNHQREMVVAKVHNNSFLPILQYSFEAPHDGFVCGEQSIRDTADGADLRIRDCFKDDHKKETAIRINTIASAKRHVIDAEPFALENVFSDTQVDFKPDLKLCKWLTNYANGKLIIHVGSGQGHLVNMLKMCRAKAIGIEPNIDKEEWIKWRLQNDGMNNFDINEILQGTVENYANLIKSVNTNAILIIACPKVKDFVRTTISIMPFGMELIYISTDDLPFVMNDPYINKEVKLLAHEGISENNESMYSIIK